jgi:hypothetical protein
MQENSGIKPQFPKMGIFRMDRFGVYRLRVLPPALNRDGSLDSKRYEYQYGDKLHVLYVLDLNNRTEGIRLLVLNRSQFRDLEDKRSGLWRQALTKNPYAVCPVSSVYNAFPVEIEKRKSGERTEHVITIDDRGENDALSLEELNALTAAPRISEACSRYLRQQAEAAIEFKTGRLRR